MGIYNTYGNVQIKVGDLTMKNFKIGDKVDIADGVYVGYGGVIVIKDSIFTMEVNTLTDKWGQPLTCEYVLKGRGLSELLDKTEEPIVTTKKDRPPIEVTQPTVEKKEEVVETKKETSTPAPEIKKEEPVIKKEEVTPESPKEEKKD